MQARLTHPLLGDVIAIDVGTTNTLIASRGRGLLVDEPSLVKLDSNTRDVIAVGEKEKRLCHRHGPQFKMFRANFTNPSISFNVTFDGSQS